MGTVAGAIASGKRTVRANVSSLWRDEASLGPLIEHMGGTGNGKLTTSCAPGNNKRTDFKMLQLLFRFTVGGLIVLLFAALGDILKPKSFAGLFGAAPSVALATVGLTIANDGRAYAATEARSMIVGAAAFCLYAALCSRLMMKNKISAVIATISALALWLGFAIGTWAVVLR